MYPHVPFIIWCGLVFLLAVCGDEESFDWMDVFIGLVCIATLVCLSLQRSSLPLPE